MSFSLPRVALLLFALGAGAWLLHLWQAPFHEDEAIYAAWSLQLVQGDPWLLATPVDKPPLTLYPIAASIALFGRQEWAARLPNFFWTALLLAMLWRIAERRGNQGWLAIALALLSPLLWALSASAFTDPAMVALALLALERARVDRGGQAGIAFALAFLAKPTALFLLPLLLVELGSTTLRSKWLGRYRAFTLAAAAPLLLAWAWDASRAAPSWWVLGAQAYGTFGSDLALSLAWLKIGAFALGLPVLGAVLLWWMTVPAPTPSRTRAWHPLWDATLLLWIPAHLLLGFQPWERYLLPLVPLLALRVASRTRASSLAGKHLLLTGGATLLLLVPFLISPLQFEPHDGRWEGIREMGEVIEALPPEATLFYADTGRPLAWYGAETGASLQWAGPEWEALPAMLASRGSQPLYLLTRPDNVPPPTADWHLVCRNNNFLLLTNGTTSDTGERRNAEAQRGRENLTDHITEQAPTDPIPGMVSRNRNYYRNISTLCSV